MVKEQAIWLYRRLTSAHRRRLLARLQRSGQVPIGVLFYHRVADRIPNPWTLSRSDFARQLDWLQDNFEIVSLAEAQARMRSQTNTQPTVSITFDDGYAENAEFAIPELTRRGLTATYFVATDFVRNNRYFPHDLAAGQPLDPNTVEQLREFESLGIEIGAHTRTHINLGLLQQPAVVAGEIVGSANDLEGWLGHRVRYFAFPFGLPENTSQAAIDVLASAGFAGCCTAYGAWNWPNSSGFHIRRIHADPGLEKLKNWLTLDSRKLTEQVEVPFVEPATPEMASAFPTCLSLSNQNLSPSIVACPPC